MMAKRTKKPNKKTYTISGLTIDQLAVIERALDMFGRIGLGQTEIIAETWQEFYWTLADKIHAGPDGKVDYDVWQRVRWAANTLKEQMFKFSPGASYGVGHPDLDKRTNIAFDMCKPIQNILVEISDPKKECLWHCWRDTPMLYSDQPLIKVEEDNANDH